MSESAAAARVVHLLDPTEGGEDAVLACRAACEAPGFEHHVWLLGTTADELRCAELGLTTTDRLSVEAGPAYRAAQTLGRLHIDRARAWGLPARAVVAWSARAAQLAEAEMWDVPARLCVLTAGPGHPDEPRTNVVRAITPSGVWRVFALGSGLVQLWTSAGVSGLTALPIPVLTGLDQGQDRSTVRAALGVKHDERMLMLLASPARAGDAHRLVSMAGIIHYAGVRVVCAMPSGSAQVDRAVRYVNLHNHRWDVLPFDGPVARASAAADALVWDLDEARARSRHDMPSGGVVLAAAAAAAGTVVVGPDHPLLREIIGGSPRLIARSASYPDLSHVLLPLLDDPAELARCGAALREAWSPAGRATLGDALGELLSRETSAGGATVSP